MQIIITPKHATYTGISHRPSFALRKPKRGGAKVEPMYALAICTPMMAWEFSGPKLSGVAWMMLG